MKAVIERRGKSSGCTSTGLESLDPKTIALTEELRRREAFLTEAQRLSQTGSFGWRVSTDVHYWSDETYRIFGYRQRHFHQGLDAAPATTLVDTIRDVHGGKTCIPGCVGKKLVETMSHPSLSARELETLKLVAEGKSNKSIADNLAITEGTVKTHVKSILHKLDAPGRTAAVRRAVHRGLIQLT